MQEQIMKKLIAISIVAASFPALAETYRGEVNAGYGMGETKFGDYKNDVSAWNVGGTYYLKDVSTDKGPLAEAAFLSKVSSVGATVSSATIEGDDGADDVTATNGAIGFHVVGSSDIIAEGSLYHSEFEDTPEKAEAISVGVGTYLDDHHAIVVSYNFEHNDNAGLLRGSETFDATYHGFLPLSGDSSLSYDASLEYTNIEYHGGGDDDGIGVNAGITYYPMKTLGLSASLGQFKAGDVTTTDYAVGAEYFFTSTIAASLAYSFDKLDDDNDSDTIDTNLVVVGVTARF